MQKSKNNQKLIKNHRVPLFLESVQAGFPTSSGDYIDFKLDLNEHLISHPAATFLVRASGSSMINIGIDTGDILIVDKSLEPRSLDVIIASIDNGLTVKRLKKINNRILLIAENDKFDNIEIRDGMDFSIWGVVTSVIKVFRK